MITLKCLECNTSFEAKRTTAKFCSTNCRVRYSKREEVKDDVPVPVFKTKLVIDSSGLKEKPSDEKIAALKAVVEKLNKDFGAGTIMRLGDKPDNNLQVVSSGSLGLDIALGVGGFPRGRIVEIYGLESSGKTTIAMHAIAEAQKLGLKCALIDAENSFDPEYATNLKINIDELFVSQPTCGEEGLEVADRLIASGGVGVVVIDSVAALIPKAEIEGQMGDNKMGLHARLMSQACRKMVASIAKTNTLCIFINQLRHKIGFVMGNPEITTGGLALQFYSSVRLEVRKSAILKDGEVSVGNKTKVKVAKNKVSPPFKIAEFDIIYGKGVDRLGEIVDIASAWGIITKAGTWFSYKESKLGQGRDKAMETLSDNPEMIAEIEKLIYEKMK